MRLKPSPPCHPRQRGITLVETLVAIAVLGIAAGGFTLYFGNSQQARRALALSKSIGEVEKYIEGTLIETVQANGCFNPSTVFASVPINGGTMSFTNNVPIVLKGGAQAQIPPATMAIWQAAAARCTQPRLAQDAKFAYYFCLRFTPSGTAAAGSFLAADLAFAEVYIDTRNMQTGAGVPCATYNGLNEAGSKVYYTVYLAQAAPKGPILKSQTFVNYIAR